MSSLKLIALLLVSFIATASIIYQIRSRRPTAASVQASHVQLPEPAAAPAPQLPANLTGAPSDLNQPHSSIPASGWGRNPFLTRDEINRANQPERVPIVEAAPVRQAEPTPPPKYAVTAIVYGPRGTLAVVNSRVVQQGDHVGFEIVKEIKTNAVVLEYEGQTRELPLKKPGGTVQLTVPKGD